MTSYSHLVVIIASSRLVFETMMTMSFGLKNILDTSGLISHIICDTFIAHLLILSVFHIMYISYLWACWFYFTNVGVLTCVVIVFLAHLQAHCSSRAVVFLLDWILFVPLRRENEWFRWLHGHDDHQVRLPPCDFLLVCYSNQWTVFEIGIWNRPTDGRTATLTAWGVTEVVRLIKNRSCNIHQQRRRQPNGASPWEVSATSRHIRCQMTKTARIVQSLLPNGFITLKIYLRRSLSNNLLLIYTGHSSPFPLKVGRAFATEM